MPNGYLKTNLSNRKQDKYEDYQDDVGGYYGSR